MSDFRITYLDTDETVYVSESEADRITRAAFAGGRPIHGQDLRPEDPRLRALKTRFGIA